MNSLSAKSPIGVFEFSEDGKLVRHKLFSRDPQKALAEFESDPVKNDKKACVFLRKNIREFAILVRSMHEEKNRLESYIKESMSEIMPNFSSLIEPLLAAKLLSLVGSLEKLARMPASTIQLLGSEKALFRHLKNQGKSPKYGILFLDRRIQSAPKEKKGKVARIIASKLMLAARIDYYSKRPEARLKEEMEKELKNVLGSLA